MKGDIEIREEEMEGDVIGDYHLGHMMGLIEIWKASKWRCHSFKGRMTLIIHRMREKGETYLQVTQLC